MKILYPYHKFVTESVRDQMTPKSKEEIDTIMKSIVQKLLYSASKIGQVSTHIDFFNPEYKKYLEEYILVEDLIDSYTCLLLYEDSIFTMSSVPGGEDYTRFDIIPNNINVFKDKLKEILKKLN